MNKKVFIKSCIRYPGGKSKALDFLIPHIPLHNIYIEPFIGGGSVFLRLAQMHPERDYHINDLFYPVYCFWKTMDDQCMTMMNYIIQKKEEYIVNRNETIKKGIATENANNGRKLHQWCRKEIEDAIIQKNEFYTACLWYILNKTSFSGMSMIGSYSKLAWDQNFSDKCIFNLPTVSDLMHSVKSLKITNLDYSELLKDTDKDTFLFLDPPYDIKDNLYGNEGDMHRGFNHSLFMNSVQACETPWMITYNDNPFIADRFKNYNCIPWELQYTMKAAKRTETGNLMTDAVKDGRMNTSLKQSKDSKSDFSGKKGKELLILNY